MRDAALSREVPADLRSELSALLAHYASRIAAARAAGLPANAILALLTPLCVEQTVAVKALLDRWQALARNRLRSFTVYPDENAASYTHALVAPQTGYPCLRILAL